MRQYCLQILKSQGVAKMFRCFKATRNPKRRKGRCGSQFQGSQNINEGETEAFSGKNVRKKLRFMSLEAKRQQANNNWLSLRIKPTKQCMHILFCGLKCIKQGLANLLRAFKAPKCYYNIFRGLKALRKLWLMFLDAKPHRERYVRRIYRSQKIKAKYSPRILKEIEKIQVQLTCFEVKMQKAKND